MKKKNVTRVELAGIIHEKLGFSRVGCGEIVDTVFAAMKEGLMAGDSIKLVQFGILQVRDKTPRIGRNPRTGEGMEICKRLMVNFRASKILRSLINE